MAWRDSNPHLPGGTLELSTLPCTSNQRCSILLSYSHDENVLRPYNLKRFFALPGDPCVGGLFLLALS